MGLWDCLSLPDFGETGERGSAKEGERRDTQARVSDARATAPPRLCLHPFSLSFLMGEGGGENERGIESEIMSEDERWRARKKHTLEIISTLQAMVNRLMS